MAGSIAAVAATDVEVSWDDDKIRELVAAPDGPVARLIERKCIAVLNAAKRGCPVDTGRLRASLSYQVTTDADGVVGYVGSNVEYAPYVEEIEPYLRPALDAARGVGGI